MGKPKMSASEIAQRIDHTLLKPDASQAAFDHLVTLAGARLARLRLRVKPAIPEAVRARRARLPHRGSHWAAGEDLIQREATTISIVDT